MSHLNPLALLVAHQARVLATAFDADDSRHAFRMLRPMRKLIRQGPREAKNMILESMFGLSLVLNVSLNSQGPTTNPAAWQQLPVPQRQATLLPMVHRATDCIVRKVSTDPRYSADMRPNEINDLIVDSISACGRVVREMIDAHDRIYGSGSGKAFLLGPYLDVLPAAVVQQVKVPAR
jgi:hypothetical protein